MRPEQLGKDKVIQGQPQIRLPSRVNPVRNPQLTSIPTGHQACPGRTANRRDGKGILEMSSLTKQAIHMGRLNPLIIRAHRPSCLIIGKQENNIGRLARRLTAGRPHEYKTKISEREKARERASKEV